MRDIEQDKVRLQKLSICHADPFEALPEALVMLRNYMAEVERLRVSEGEANEALAACQAQASAEIRNLRAEVERLKANG